MVQASADLATPFVPGKEEAVGVVGSALVTTQISDSS